MLLLVLLAELDEWIPSAVVPFEARQVVVILR